MAEDFGGDVRLGALYDAVVTTARMLETYAQEINWARPSNPAVARGVRAAWAQIAAQIALVERQLAALPAELEGAERGDPDHS